MKVIIGDKGKAWKLELEPDSFSGKSIGDSIAGKDVKAELEGYLFLISGGSDSAGFPLSKDAEGLGLKKVLLTKGFGMQDTRAGVRLRKTVRGKQISSNTAQLNLKVVQAGNKKFEEIFPEQNQPKPKAVKAEAAPAAPPAA